MLKRWTEKFKKYTGCLKCKSNFVLDADVAEKNCNNVQSHIAVGGSLLNWKNPPHSTVALRKQRV